VLILHLILTIDCPIREEEIVGSVNCVKHVKHVKQPCGADFIQKLNKQKVNIA